MTIEQKIKRIRKMVIHHDLLDSQNVPVITDSEYDDLYIQLVNLENEHPELITPDSPTQKIYATVVDGLKKVKHPEPMLSQAKIKTAAEIRKFASMIDGDIIVELKLDGLTVVLDFENEVFNSGVTRGSGVVGEDITHTAKTVKNLPKRINTKEKIILRGEAILPFDEFNRIVETEDYSNPRNLVSGTMRQLDASVAQARNVKILTFECIELAGMEFETDSERLEYLKSLNFDVVPYKVFKKGDVDALVEYCETYSELVRPGLSYMVDGLVLKTNDLKERLRLGSTSKHPKWSCAYKFESLEAVTTLKNVVWQVGKTGQITPVAEFDSVNIDGVNINRATLHNLDYITKKDIRIGDKIVVARANDVIPQVTQSLKSEREEHVVPVKVPTSCPVCGAYATKVRLADGEESSSIFCQGLNCPSQLSGKIKHFVSRNAMNIDGLGDKTVDLMVERNIISTIDELYVLHDNPELFYGIEGFGDRKFEKMVEGIEESKSRPLSQVLYALSIPMVGTSTAKILAKHYRSMTAMVEASKNPDSFIDTIQRMEGIGQVVAENVHDFFADNWNGLIKELLDRGLKMEEEVSEIVVNKITGKTFVVTGEVLQYANRKELQADIEKHGGKCSGSVSKNTHFLINNDIESTSGKNKDAQKLGVPIITEQEFVNMKNEM